jgi:hypothetical protein
MFREIEFETNKETKIWLKRNLKETVAQRFLWNMTEKEPEGNCRATLSVKCDWKGTWRKLSRNAFCEILPKRNLKETVAQRFLWNVAEKEPEGNCRATLSVSTHNMCGNLWTTTGLVLLRLEVGQIGLPLPRAWI